MTQVNEVHVGDEGTSIEVVILDEDNEPLDISTATAMVIKIRARKKQTKAIAASFVTDGSDGKIHIITDQNTLDFAGKWKIQAHVTLPEGAWSSDQGEFEVFSNL
jgi:hypothetical protein